MSDAEFVNSAFVHFNALDEAAGNLADADTAKPRDPKDVMVAYKDMEPRILELRRFITTRLDELAVRHLGTQKGQWSIEFLNDVESYHGQPEDYFRRVRGRYEGLRRLQILLGDSDSGTHSMPIQITRDDWRTYKIDPAILTESVQTMLSAVESGVYANISNAWDAMRYTIAPNPGGTTDNIEASDLPGAAKAALETLLGIGLVGPHEFKARRRESLGRMRDCLATVGAQQVAATSLQKAPAIPLSHTDLPNIVEAIRELIRALESPQQWAKKNLKELPEDADSAGESYFLQEASREAIKPLLPLLMPSGVNDYVDGHWDISNSALDLNARAKLKELRRFLLTAQNSARIRTESEETIVWLETVIAELSGPILRRTNASPSQVEANAATTHALPNNTSQPIPAAIRSQKAGPNPDPILALRETVDAKLRAVQQAEFEKRRGERLWNAVWALTHPPGCDRPETNLPELWTASVWTRRFMEAAAALRKEGTSVIPESWRQMVFPVEHQAAIELWRLAFEGDTNRLESKIGEGMSHHDATKTALQFALVDVNLWLTGHHPPGDCSLTPISDRTGSSPAVLATTRPLTEQGLPDPKAVAAKEVREQCRDWPTPTVGVITALPHETAAVRMMLGDPPRYDVPGSGAGRAYWRAKVNSPVGGVHHVVIAQAGMGTNIAAVRASLLLTHFAMVESIIMCGIAGGIPNAGKASEHVRLGDIVVSNLKGVVQYDFVKSSRKNRAQVINEVRSSPHRPSARLLEAVQLLETNMHFGQFPWETFLQARLDQMNWNRPNDSTDILVDSNDANKTLQHPHDEDRRQDQPRIFSAPIASANTLLKDPIKRDALRTQFGTRAAEMESSGIVDATWTHEVGYLVVRGICDYCDSNKGDHWQKYAAMAAAAYVRSVLEAIPGVGA